MARRSLGDIEEHAFYTIFMGILIVMFWYTVWELMTELVQYIHYRYYIPKWKIYVCGLLSVVLLIDIFPQILKKL